MKKITKLFIGIIFCSLAQIFSVNAQNEVIAVIQEPFVLLLDTEDGSIIDNSFIDLTPLSPGTPKDILQVGQQIWISDQLEDRIDRFDLEGNYVSTISGGLDNIKGMEVVNGEIWVTNAGSNNGAPGDAIVRFDTSGNNLGFIDTAGISSFDIIDVGTEVYISYIGSSTSKIERRDYSGNVLGDILGVGVVNFIQQIELNPDNNSVYAAVFSNLGGNTGGIYEFSVADGAILDSWEIGSMRGVTQLGNGNLLVSAGTNFGVQILDPSNGTTTPISGSDSAHYFESLTLCTPPSAPTGDANQTFNEGATVADIVVTPSDVTWFASENDALNNENPLDPSTLLVDGSTYYAVTIVDDCLSVPFAVTITLILGNEDLGKQGISVYPNPVTSILNITSTNLELESAIIYSIQGSKLLEIGLQQGYTTIDLSNLSSGIYILKVQSSSQTFSTQLIKR